MLLNNFLYTRSLIQNEHFHFRTSFSSLIPKTRVNEDLKNPLESEEYKEEIKNVRIGGRSRREKKLQEEKERLQDEKETLQEEKEKLQEEKEELEEENELLENDKQIETLTKKNEKIEKKNDELEEENDELEEENNALEEENNTLEEENDELEEENDALEEEKKEMNNEIISHEFNNRKITLDNISKEGGNSHDKDIKNVVVSFF